MSDAPAPPAMPGPIPQRQYSAVDLDPEHRFAVAFDTTAKDPITQAYLSAMGSSLDRNLVDLMLALSSPGGSVVDVGAFLGTFALAAACMGRRVLAIEASEHNVQLLRYGASKSGYKDMVIVHGAASDHFGELRFRSDGPYGQVVDPASGDDPPAETVGSVRIDPLLRRLGWRVDFVKIDIEGSEMWALHGMSELLTRPDAPPVLFESNLYDLRRRGWEPRDPLSLVRGFGYDLYLVLDSDKRLVRVSPEYLQLTTVVNYLGFKGTPEINGWSVVRELTWDEQADRVATEAAFDDIRHRCSVARSLESAPAGLLSHPRVEQARATLAADPQVAEALRQLPGRQPPPAAPEPPAEPLTEEVAAESALRAAAEAMTEAVWVDASYLATLVFILSGGVPAG